VEAGKRLTESAGFAYRAAMKLRALPVLFALFSLSALPFAAAAEASDKE
jgi:hypothetical protein